MKLKEALMLLDASVADETPSALNKLLTKAHVVKIVRNAVAIFGHPKDKPCELEDDIDPFMEKRVYQVYLNKLRPIY